METYVSQLLAQQKDYYLTNRKSKSKQKNGEHQKMRKHKPVRNFLGDRIELPVLAKESFHRNKINIRASKKQEFKISGGIFFHSIHS
jgi:hypothetical protein